MSIRRGAPLLGCRFFRTTLGAEPVRQWLKNQERLVRLEIGADIQKVQWRWPVSRPLVGAMGDGLYEVRTAFEGSQYRVFFCVHDGSMVLLHAFQKKTQKTPLREFRLAQQRYKELTR